MVALEQAEPTAEELAMGELASGLEDAVEFGSGNRPDEHYRAPMVEAEPVRAPIPQRAPPAPIDTSFLDGQLKAMHEAGARRYHDWNRRVRPDLNQMADDQAFAERLAETLFEPESAVTHVLTQWTKLERMRYPERMIREREMAEASIPSSHLGSHSAPIIDHTAALKERALRTGRREDRESFALSVLRKHNVAGHVAPNGVMQP